MNLPDAFWLVPVLAVPLALAAIALTPAMRARSLSLLPFAPLPALTTALLAPDGTAFEAANVLLGAKFSLDGQARLFLGFTAFLWMAAGIFARATMQDAALRGRFATFWCLTLAGNLGVFLAADVATFYAAFACVSLAAYPLIVHTGSPRAIRAGLVYIVLALIGETCLLVGFMLGAAGAETLLIEDVRAAIATSPWRGAAMLLLLTGFGIKAGLVPLHVWLPLAHPAAPTPASTVLSGAIVKAGIFGFIQFLPFGVALPAWQDAMLAGGLFTAFFGIAIGLTQQNPKTVLAYSTLSQMGLVIAVLATALQAGEAQAALAVAGFYALHHGFAKGALFMGVGVVAASGARAVVPMLAVLLLPALSLAGFPLTSGALAKLAAKPVLGGGAVEFLFTLSAVGTALVMFRFLLTVAAANDNDPQARPAIGLLLPWLSTVAASLFVPWLLYAAVTGEPISYPLGFGNLWIAFWPVIAAVVIAALARAGGMRAPGIPEGDLLTPMTSLISWIRSISSAEPIWNASFRVQAKRLALPTGDWACRIERLLSRGSLSGTLLLLLVILAAL